MDTTKFKDVLESLLRTRLSMLKMNDCIRQKMLSIPIHMALGHEAIAVAVSTVKHSNDSVVLSHRNMHYNFAMTQRPELISLSSHIWPNEFATDGSGGTSKGAYKMVTSSIVYRKPNGTFAILTMIAPGRQTVPRAELNAIVAFLFLPWSRRQPATGG